MVSLRDLRLRAARARIAAACVPPPVDPRLGSIVLREDQRVTAARVLDALQRHGGCLLADDVGRGKTYVALAVARSWRRPLVVAPASLRSTWREAMQRSGISCALISHEELSRGRQPRESPDGIVVDESHHFRSTNTRRHAVLAALASAAPALLLSATPLQNRTRDLAAQIALFHGSRAFDLDAAALASFVVRGGMAPHDLLPAVAPPRWVSVTMDDGEVLEAILSLPAPPRPLDGGDAGVLRTISLVRAWASSRAALRAALRRRRRIAVAIEASAMDGRAPTRRELAGWREMDGAIQLGFASLLAAASAAPSSVAELLDAAAAEQAALTQIEAVLARSGDPDLGRARALSEIRSAHPGERVLAFTELATTADMYFRMLRGAPGVGLLTARHARIASGYLPRGELLERFAPRAACVRPPPEREQVTALIATDLLSEGVNLQDASVVVQLDLPWNPARLAQRIGRVRRPGGAATVHSYLLAPPAGAELLLDVERRLRHKLDAAARTIGHGIDVVPTLAPRSLHTEPGEEGLAAQRGEAMERVRRWARSRRPGELQREPRMIMAGVESSRKGWMAALDDGRLIAALDGAPPNTDSAVGPSVRHCCGAARPLSERERMAALTQCERWIDTELVARQCGHAAAARRFDRALDRRIAQAMERTPRHLRAAAAASASRLIVAAGDPRPLGAERELARLVDQDPRAADGDLLADLAAGSGRFNARRTDRRDDARSRIVALIAFGPGQG